MMNDMIMKADGNGLKGKLREAALDAVYELSKRVMSEVFENTLRVAASKANEAFYSESQEPSEEASAQAGEMLTQLGQFIQGGGLTSGTLKVTLDDDNTIEHLHFIHEDGTVVMSKDLGHYHLTIRSWSEDVGFSGDNEINKSTLECTEEGLFKLFFEQVQLISQDDSEE